MNSSTSDIASQPATSGHGANTADPLLEQMTSILRLAGPSSTQRRERRYSDADRPRSTTGDPIARPDPVAILSTDGSRRLAAPDEQSHPKGSGISTGNSAEPPQERDAEQHTCTAAVCSVVKVFQTTELLELIFNFLEFRDVLSLRTASRHCQSVVQESKHLRLQFFREGQWRRPHAQFQLLPLSLPGVTIDRGVEIDLGQWIEVSFTPEAARRIAPEPKPTKRVRSRSIFEGLRGGLGTRAPDDPWPAKNPTPSVSRTLEYEDLLIAQPPVLSMQAYIVNPKVATNNPEGEEVDSGPPARAKLWCDSGITLGVLAETVQSLLARNHGRSNADDVKVLYKAIMSFSAPDQAPRKPRGNEKTVIYI